VWDAAQTYWDDWVLGYGFGAQRALLESFGITSLRRAQRWAMLLALTVSATVLALLALSLYLGWRYRRRRRDPAARCFDRFCRTLGRLAVAPRAPHEGPEAYARRAQQALPGAAEAIAGIVAAYLRARYEPDADRAALASLRRRVAAFRAT
jgi:hypothetical protein